MVVQPQYAPLDTIAGDRFGMPEARHLLLRAGFGGTPAQVRAMAEMGPEAAVDLLLDTEGTPFRDDTDGGFSGEVIVPLTPAQRSAYRRAQQTGDEDTLARFRGERQRQQRADREQIRGMQRWWLERIIETPKPLEEKMTLFWHGHFATSYRTIENSYHMLMQNRLFRRHALGNVGDLLFSIIRDPAMLAYLDNNDSRRDAPNENLARELMELFSLGAGNYSERDIKEGARALTGYTFEGNEFVLDRRNHDSGTKAILGQRGAIDGDGFVRAILAQRACAGFIARKLYGFFATDLPQGGAEASRETEHVISGLTDDLIGARYEIKPMLRRLLLSRHFYTYDVMNARIRSPIELIAQTIRSLGAPARSLSVLADASASMGQNLFFPPNVAGWPGGRTWISSSTLFVRQNLCVYLLTGRLPSDEGPSDSIDVEIVLDGLAPSRRDVPEAVAEHLLRHATGFAIDEDVAILSEILKDASSIREGVTKALVLVTSMPKYQLC
ncbi:MAG: DUF1800 domain-containing protein [Planctomycetota bacterium]